MAENDYKYFNIGSIIFQITEFKLLRDILFEKKEAFSVEFDFNDCKWTIRYSGDTNYACWDSDDLRKELTRWKASIT